MCITACVGGRASRPCVRVNVACVCVNKTESRKCCTPRSGCLSSAPWRFASANGTSSRIFYVNLYSSGMRKRQRHPTSHRHHLSYCSALWVSASPRSSGEAWPSQANTFLWMSHPRRRHADSCAVCSSFHTRPVLHGSCCDAGGRREDRRHWVELMRLPAPRGRARLCRRCPGRHGRDARSVPAALGCEVGAPGDAAGRTHQVRRRLGALGADGALSAAPPSSRCARAGARTNCAATTRPP